jgi:predicted CXXCH cytochrome family protein
LIPLAAFLVALLAAAGTAAQSVHPHVDVTLNPGGCLSCHEGHGMSRSPMLPEPQIAVCNRCHGSRTDLNRQVFEGHLGSAAEPSLLFNVFSQPFRHPLSERAFSRREPNVVTCTSCHSPHRSMPGDRSGSAPTGIRKPSPRDPNRFEFELCQECHGSGGVTTRSLDDVSRLFDLSNRSYHPVQASAMERSPSVVPSLSGREVNCTDCHGNSDPLGPQGPHGSAVRYLLRREYSTSDGEDESPIAYRLCYTCHEREKIFEELSPFPLHGVHVRDEGASCATCHSAHGSISNRALIRFGEETVVGAVMPSSGGRLSFESTSSGSGQCYLTCHGVDHNPMGYGFDAEPAGIPGLLRRPGPHPQPLSQGERGARFF